MELFRICISTDYRNRFVISKSSFAEAVSAVLRNAFCLVRKAEKSFWTRTLIKMVRISKYCMQDLMCIYSLEHYYAVTKNDIREKTQKKILKIKRIAIIMVWYKKIDSLFSRIS